MKSIYLPISLLEDQLPKMHPLCTNVLVCLLSHSDAFYKPVWPSIGRISELTNIKSPNTIRARQKELSKEKVIAIQTKTEVTKFGIRMANTYFFTFEKWITIDRKNGFAGSGENIQQMQADRIEKAIKKVDNRLDRLEFTFKDLPASLREWEKHLVHTGDFQGTHYFNSIGNISPSFAEESFKKHGYNIKILKSA